MRPRAWYANVSDEQYAELVDACTGSGGSLSGP
jgi:hypothetical protein